MFIRESSARNLKNIPIANKTKKKTRCIQI